MDLCLELFGEYNELHAFVLGKSTKKTPFPLFSILKAKGNGKGIGETLLLESPYARKETAPSVFQQIFHIGNHSDVFSMGSVFVYIADSKISL